MVEVVLVYLHLTMETETLLIAAIGVEPAVKYSFVEKGTQMVRKGQ